MTNQIKYFEPSMYTWNLKNFHNQKQSLTATKHSFMTKNLVTQLTYSDILMEMCNSLEFKFPLPQPSNYKKLKLKFIHDLAAILANFDTSTKSLRCTFFFLFLFFHSFFFFDNSTTEKWKFWTSNVSIANVKICQLNYKVYGTMSCTCIYWSTCILNWALGCWTILCLCYTMKLQHPLL